MVCSNMVDYSTVIGERILPFVFTLNEEKSVLEPEEGEKQKFCYDVEGVGQDKPEFADLSHFLLGICKDITRDEILDVTVTIDGEPRQVIWGVNVEIKTEEKPDPKTGCVGLKFDFGLDKVDGEMEVCFTLARTFAVGTVNVCVFGGNVTATGMEICGPVCGGKPSSCKERFFQKAKVCVPVKVKPFAMPGKAIVRCCDDPVIMNQKMCQGGDDFCNFTVTQELCIEIPIKFGADVETGQAKVQCKDVSQTPCDCDNDDDGDDAAGLIDSLAGKAFKRNLRK